MSKKTITIDAPKVPVIRYRFLDDRHVELDLRGIRNPQSPFNGRLNPTKGQKRRFLSPTHLQSAVDEYFESCNGPLIDRQGNLVYDKDGHLVKTQVKPCTLSGLALYLGLNTETLRKYRKGKLDTILDEMRAETDDTLTFSKVITTAKQRIEAYAEGRLYDRDGQRGAQFVLDCCYHWVESRPKSDIKRAKAEVELKQKEFELKQKLLDEGESDNDLTINIVRGHKPVES